MTTATFTPATTEPEHTEGESVRLMADQPAAMEAVTPHSAQEREATSPSVDSEQYTPRRSSSRLSSKRAAAAESPGAKSPMSTPTKKGRKTRPSSDDVEPATISLTETDGVKSEPSAPQSDEPARQAEQPAQPTLHSTPADAHTFQHEALPVPESASAGAQDAAPTCAAPETCSSEEVKPVSSSEETKENGNANIAALSAIEPADNKKHAVLEAKAPQAQCDATPASTPPTAAETTA